MRKKVSKEEFLENNQKAEKMLQEEEQQKPLQVRKTEGDASESGLIKFIQPTLKSVCVRHYLSQREEKEDWN